jgi:uncharacterized membrane protein YgcG
MNTYNIGQENIDKNLIELGDKIQLSSQVQEVVKCIKTGVKMLNIDADQLKPGDLNFIKKLGLTISNPETKEPIALGVEYKSFGRKLADWFERESDEEDNDDDDDFFSSTPSSSGSIFGGSSGFGGFGGGFGGFGGGSFGGGGMSRGF